MTSFALLTTRGLKMTSFTLLTTRGLDPNMLYTAYSIWQTNMKQILRLY